MKVVYDAQTCKASFVGFLVDIQLFPTGLVKADGVTDDTAAINSIVQYAVANDAGVYFPSGIYMVQATGSDTNGNVLGGIIINAPINIEMESGAVLKAITGTKAGYSILNIQDTVGVNIDGGTIIGDKDTHDVETTGHNWGFGIRIKNSTVSLSNIIIQDCMDDGIYIGDTVAASSNVSMDNVSCINNNRNNLTIAGGIRFDIVNSEFSGANVYAPKAGIDIEDESFLGNMVDITIDNCIFKDNETSGCVAGKGDFERFTVINSTFIDNYKAIVFGSTTSQLDILFSGNTIANTIQQQLGIGLSGVGGLNIVITNNSISNVKWGLYTEGADIVNAFVNGNVFENNELPMLLYATFVDSTIQSA